MTRLAGARVLLTGASSGIGRASALALARRGADLTLTGRDADRLDDLARTVGGRAVPADLADPGDTDRLVEAVTRDGLPDVVVHNAGLGAVGSAAGTDTGDLDTLLRVNLGAPAQITAALLPGLCARGSGHLLFVTSIAAHVGVPQESAYAATKAALAGYAASLRGEVAGTGVRVSTLAPGVVDTDFFRRRGAPYQRRFPRPLPADRVAAALVDCLERERAEVVVPGWLRLPIALRSVAPNVYARLEDRWG